MTKEYKVEKNVVNHLLTLPKEKKWIQMQCKWAKEDIIFDDTAVEQDVL